MNVAFDRKNNVNATLTIEIGRQDYTPPFEQELQKLKQKAQFKGFRKGKVPSGMVKKLYGTKVLVDVINDLVQKQINDYLTGEKIAILGYPIPADDQAIYEFDPDRQLDYSFRYDIGIAPEFELAGIGADDTYQRYQVIISDEMIDKEMTDLLKRAGSHAHPESDIRPGDLIKIEATELEGGDVKEGGHSTSFTISVDDITDEAVRTAVLGAAKGHTLDIDIYQLENKGEAHARKYLLNLPADSDQVVGPAFRAVIQEVTRHESAGMDQEFFDKVFGEGKIDSEAAAREELKKFLGSRFEGREDALLFRDLQEALLEKNDFELPDAFLRRWLSERREEGQPELTEEAFDGFVKNLRWSLIRERITKDFDVTVTEEELRDAFRDRVAGYMGGYQMDGAFLDDMVERLMKNEKTVQDQYDELITDKMFLAVRNQVRLEPVAIAEADFLRELESARKAAEAVRHDHNHDHDHDHDHDDHDHHHHH